MDRPCLRYRHETCVSWLDLPGDIWVRVLSYLYYGDILIFGQVSRHCRNLASDKVLWRNVFQRYWHVQKPRLIFDNARCWLHEFKRLYYDAPVKNIDTASHTNEVLHVSFSKTGQYLVTSSKDQTIKLFDVSQFSLNFLNEVYFGDLWEYVQFTEFSADDRMLLVSGVIRNLPFVFKGEIEVFLVEDIIKGPIDGEPPSCLFRVASEPYDAFGCWFSSSALITAFYQVDEIEGHDNLSVSDLWMFDMSEVSQRKIVQVLNMAQASVKLVHVAQPKTLRTQSQSSSSIATKKNINSTSRNDYCTECLSLSRGEFGNYRSTPLKQPPSVEAKDGLHYVQTTNSEDRTLIFVHGTTTYVPHLLVFIHNLNQDSEESEELVLNSVARSDNNIVRAIDTKSYIIGMALSPDQRFVYVNCRKWISEPGTGDNDDVTPGIDVNIELRKYDIETLELVDTVQGHRADISVTSCFFIYPDVAQDFVASGAEDSYAHIWERNYGCKIATLGGHTSVVNAVAFNPHNQEMLASVSDDFTVKLWVSRRLEKELQK